MIRIGLPDKNCDKLSLPDDVDLYSLMHLKPSFFLFYPHYMFQGEGPCPVEVGTLKLLYLSFQSPNSSNL